MNRLIRSAIYSWLRWRLYRALPELRYLDQAREAARRQHKPYKHFDKAREALITSALRSRRLQREGY